jgi:hypothetical protein
MRSRDLAAGDHGDEVALIMVARRVLLLGTTPAQRHDRMFVIYELVL